MSQRDKKLLVYLAALLILAGAYFFVGRPFIEKIDVQENDKIALQNELSQTQLAYSRQQEFADGITKGQAKIDEIMSKFPADNTDEKSIMFISDAETAIPMDVSQVNFAEATEVLVSGGEVESASDREQQALDEAIAANDEDYEAEASSEISDNTQEDQMDSDSGVDGMTARSTNLGINFTCNYEAFKNLLAYIRDYENRIIISDMNVTYDQSERLVSGSMTLTQYALAGDGRQLPEVVTNVDSLGLGNIFVSDSTVLMGVDSGSSDSESANTDEPEDYFIMLNTVTDNTTGITMGRANDVPGTTYITSNANTKEDVTFKVTGSDELYTVEYQIGNSSYVDDIMEDDGSILLRVISTERRDNQDNVEIALHVTNESDIAVNVEIEGEDENAPRVDIVEQNGNVTVR